MIFVDGLLSYPGAAVSKRYGSLWCHLMESDNDTGELVAFAQSIGMRQEWLQHGDDPAKAHFDLVPSRRALAIRAGAVDLSRDPARFLAVIKRKRELARGEVQAQNE